MQRITNASERRLAASPSRLRVLLGPQRGLEVALPAAGLLVGAEPTAGLALQDGAVSGRHCTIVPGEHGFTVADLGSRNGTWLEDVALTRAIVPVGTILRVGGTLLQLLPAEETVAIPPSTAPAFGELVGASVAMRQVYALLERASQSDATVLLGGESGTGKELAARAIHAASPRRDGPFVVFDCGAASDNLIESDLFGHVRGAFTGASTDRVGAFAAAHQGTLLLDEIGDLPLHLQTRLLRLLESGEVTPLGGRRSERYDVRILAATHRDLWREAEEGRFRADLYYRLAVVEVELPALRRRRDDIPVLVRRFLARGPLADAELAGANLERLMAHAWPGNVRELRNVIARAVALRPPGAGFAELPILLGPARRDGGGAPDPAPVADRPYHDAKAELLERFERSYLTDLLSRQAGNLSQAARQAGVERKYLYKLLDKHGLGRGRPPSGESDG